MTEQAEPEPPAPFRDADILDMFRAILRGNDKPPTQAACAKAGRDLHIERRIHDALAIINPSIAAEVGTRYARVKTGFAAMQKALNGVNRAMPAFESALVALREVETLFDSLSWWPRSDMVVASRVLENTARKLKDLAKPPASLEPTDFERVMEILFIFQQAMKSTNPFVDYKMSADGPATRFIQRGLALCYDITMTPAAIRQIHNRAWEKSKPEEW